MSECLRVPFSPDLVKHIGEAGVAAADAGRGLDELGRGQWETEHHHRVEPVDVDAMREHRTGGHDMDTLGEVVLWLLQLIENCADLVEVGVPGQLNTVDAALDRAVAGDASGGRFDVVERRAIDNVRPIEADDSRRVPWVD